MDRLALVERISSISGESAGEIRETLDRMVEVIAEGMQVEACSLYLFDAERRRLILRATVGLEPETVGKISMRVNEGLVGMVIESGEPIAVPDAISHPRYKYFPETGEERFHTFLGVPVTGRGGQPMGVLVAQTRARRKFSRAEIRLLKTAANQVALVLTHFRLRQTLATTEKERQEYRRRMIEANRQLKGYVRAGGRSPAVAPAKTRRPQLVGLSAAPGFATGKAHVVGRFLITIDLNQRSRDPRAEEARLEEALAHSRAELRALKSRMAPLMSTADLEIFDGHLLILKDEEFLRRTRDMIGRGYTAESALFRVIDELSAAMLALADSYLRERAADFRDVGHRVLRHLRHEDSGGAFSEPTVLVAEELTLSQLTLVSHKNLVGIVLQSGGATSHTAILARAFEIPTVVGTEHLMESVAEGDRLVVDGNSGVVYVSPSPEIERNYQRLARRYAAFRRELMSHMEAPSVTRDGHRVHLMANIALLADIQLALHYGAEGIGLLRSEFSFLTYEDFPDEDQQVVLYGEMIEKVGGRPVTIRTLDIGADKYPPYLRVPREDNPFLGWRSIRISLEMPRLFKVQLRAILRVAAGRDVRILFPMISSIEELRRARELLDEARDELDREGIEHNPAIEVGIMVEVPSAVRLAPLLAREVDFFSIGTNDLIQYLLAADRNNPRVAHLYEAFHPAIISALDEVVRVARRAHCRVSICGEMASDPLATLLLIGIGLDELSLSPLFIPVVRRIIREVDFKTARAVARKTLQMASVQEIKGFLFDRYRTLGLINLIEMYR